MYYTSDPVGWATNLGNSRMNNGCGGDYGTSSFDGELWVIRPPVPPHPPFEYDLGVETNDFGHQTYSWGQGRGGGTGALGNVRSGDCWSWSWLLSLASVGTSVKAYITNAVRAIDPPANGGAGLTLKNGQT